MVSVPLLFVGILLAGFGAGLFGHATLTATIRSAPRDHVGLSLGAWGAVQATAAGLAIATGGVVRDSIVATGAVGATAATSYTTVFLLEAGLLTLALLLALPLRGLEPRKASGPGPVVAAFPAIDADAQGAAAPFANTRTR
jgi:BCD family chlorophyll transporter-like MFS transporter